jgi:hypothetical protein
MVNYGQHYHGAGLSMFRRKTIRKVHRIHPPWVMDESQRMSLWTPHRLSGVNKSSTYYDVTNALRRTRRRH